ncbi:claspin-like isoform X2 [Eriocheir sinensis]|uniref:claspin-like isoform X2 n=1 Tax=Eriocheir sinensis TaxID=95602 RepID=UPI0021C684F4|nr:claspin-like isoform X2 [Eriocheir sinensis]
MLALQDPTEIGGGEVNPEAMNSEDENGVSIVVGEVKRMDSKTASIESGVNGMEEEDVEDFDPQVSSGRRKMIILSDDEDSNPPSASVPSRLMDNEEESVGQRKHMITSDSENEDDGLFSKEITIPKPKFVYNPDLFDTELSDEDQPTRSDEAPLTAIMPEESEEPVPQKNKKKGSKPRQSSVRAQQEIQREIHSESQRLVRESRVSLPYHRPKQRTLAEFLARRKQSMPPEIKKQSLKMSMRNMEALRLLEEKKKQAEEFYKSDSDGEDLGDLDWTPAKEDDIVATEDNLISSTTTEKNDKQIGSEKQLSLCTGTEEKDKPIETEEESSCTTTHLISNDTLPDLHALPTESSTQNMESQDSCSESLLITNHAVVSSEDKGMGTSENNTQINVSISLHTAPSGDTANKQYCEDTSPLIECVNDKTEALQSEGVKEVANTKGTDDEDETVSSEVMNKVSKELHEDNKTNNTDKDELQTPKVNLLRSKLPEEEIKKIMAVTPRLSLGKEGDFIDLEETSTPSQDPGMVELINRFMRHSNIKRKPAEKREVNLNIVSKEDDGSGGKCLVSSNLQVTLDAEEEESSETVPGARLTSLKTALKARIREQREKQRLRRFQEKQFMETEDITEGFQYEDNLPDEEAELTDRSDTDYETESEPEENDMPLIDKKVKKNCFMDDEAEEENEEELEPNANDSENEEECPAPNSDDENDTSEATKERKRIIKDPEDESEEEESRSLTLNWEETQDVRPNSDSGVISRSNTDDLFPGSTLKKGESLDKDTSTASFDSSFELYGSVIAGHQPGGGTKHSGETEPAQALTKNKSGSFSSITSSSNMRQQELTLPADDSFDIFNTEATSASQGLVLPFTYTDSTQLLESNKETDGMPKLQLDFSRIDGTQNKDDLIDLCSGQFTVQAADSSQMTDLCEDHVSPTQEMSDLLGLCTGRFAGPKAAQSSPLKTTPGGPAMLPLSQDEPDDDELLGLCTAKFTMSDSQAESQSEAKEARMTKKDKDKREDSPQMVIYSSDEEDSVDVKNKSVRRLKRKRVLEFSDDEDAQQPLAFDDEENEVPMTVFSGFKDQTKGGIRADFLENEAELSGSDENSDDEMERSDDDDMEEEEGDLEHFDSNELRNQVGKAHLRSLLDSDKREVRLLQELYLEDGELHGQGRSRQFRWKNLDKNIEEDERKRLSDDDEGSDDNMEDSQWRKQKIEREKFLEEQRAKMVDLEAESFEVNSWGKAQNLMKRDLENRKPSPLAPAVPQTTRMKPSFSFKLQPKRGSFLSRDKSTLARIAEFTKDQRDVVGGAKQRGNFVFQQLSADEVQEEKLEVEKVEVTLQKRHSLPITKKAKVDLSSKGSGNNRLSSVIFKYL